MQHKYPTYFQFCQMYTHTYFQRTKHADYRLRSVGKHSVSPKLFVLLCVHRVQLGAMIIYICAVQFCIVLHVL